MSKNHGNFRAIFVKCYFNYGIGEKNTTLEYRKGENHDNSNL